MDGKLPAGGRPGKRVAKAEPWEDELAGAGTEPSDARLPSPVRPVLSVGRGGNRRPFVEELKRRAPGP